MINIISPKTNDDFKNYYELRYNILNKPWGFPKGTEKDDYEPVSRHFMAVDDVTGHIVGVIKLMKKEDWEGWFSHLAVDENYQSKGIGKMLLTFIEKEAKSEGFTVLGCQTRINETEYFTRMGYVIRELPAHLLGTNQVVWMQKDL